MVSLWSLIQDYICWGTGVISNVYSPAIRYPVYFHFHFQFSLAQINFFPGYYPLQECCNFFQNKWKIWRQILIAQGPPIWPQTKLCPISFIYTPEAHNMCFCLQKNIDFYLSATWCLHMSCFVYGLIGITILLEKK